jgi:cobalt-precorrin-5B (C1)-methyltransferase
MHADRVSRDGGAALRYGWTTGTWATTGAYTALLTGELPDPVRIDLPNDNRDAAGLPDRPGVPA